MCFSAHLGQTYPPLSISYSQYQCQQKTCRATRDCLNKTFFQWINAVQQWVQRNRMPKKGNKGHLEKYLFESYAETPHSTLTLRIFKVIKSIFTDKANIDIRAHNPRTGHGMNSYCIFFLISIKTKKQIN